ncbi:MAG: hypothetical protein M0Z54_01075 [Thermaerobacter sp.]|nr:hypothetical protein [Thermaerobacter sp.]
MPQDFTVRPARADDAGAIADFADVRRRIYQAYSPVFWRPAADARMHHAPFLAACLADGHHTAFVAESRGVVVGAAIANHRVRVPPFALDDKASWLVDDFYVAAPDWWRTVGGALLESVAAAARVSRPDRLIVVSAGRDGAKNAMLQDRAFRQEATWWVRPLDPPESPVPAEEEPLPMLVGSAPSVYDPGGPVALALDTAPPFAVDRFERQALAAEAVLAIVPVRTAAGTLTEVLAAAGYGVASVWYVRGA